jgi:hypothetical protein
MEKGDKPKPKYKIVVKKDKKKIRKAPKQSQTKEQKQEQKQSVKIVIGETKPKRKYVRKAKVAPRPVANIVRGQTAVSYLGGEGDLNQVITGPSPSRQNIQQAISKTVQPPPRPPLQPPLLSQTQAPTTLDTELNARSELMYPVARTPVFEERKKKLVVKKKKPILVKISEGIGDFIKQNLLDQPADLKLQEANNSMEMPRPPLTIQPESYPDIIKIKPVKVKPVRKQREGKFDVPISIVASKQVEIQEMGMEDVNVIPNIKAKEAEEMGMEDINRAVEKEQLVGIPVEKEQLVSIPVEKKQEKIRKPRKKKNIVLIEDEAEVVSMEDPQPISKQELNESLRKLIVADTIDDMINTIETPVFSENPDFKTISQNVEVDNVPSNELDFGDEGLTQFNIDGFVPVGRSEGMEEATSKAEKKKKGRPKKYENPELARQMKKLQTTESNKRLAEQRRLEKELMAQEERQIKQINLQQEYDDFSALEQETNNIRYLVETIKEQKKQEAENPYSYEALNPNAPKIYVAEEIQEQPMIMVDIGKNQEKHTIAILLVGILINKLETYLALIIFQFLNQW